MYSKALGSYPKNGLAISNLMLLVNSAAIEYVGYRLIVLYYYIEEVMISDHIFKIMAHDPMTFIV